MMVMPLPFVGTMMGMLRFHHVRKELINQDPKLVCVDER